MCTIEKKKTDMEWIEEAEIQLNKHIKNKYLDNDKN